MRPLLTLVTLAPLLVACGEAGDRDPQSTMTAATQGPGSLTAATGSSTGEATAPTEASGPGSEGITASSEASGVSGDEPPMTTGAAKFDLGEPGTTTTGDADSGCKKVDFLFVIDNSASMEDNQAALIASFPGFITAIKAQLPGADDYHIMVVDTDDDGRCKQPCNKADANIQKFCATDSYYACDTPLSKCDLTRGAGVVHPVGLFASNKPCEILGGNRYMLAQEPDLLATFACVATVGTAGNPSERPMNGMTAALAPEINAPDGCNAGFLRDDAILVITFISDDPNYEDKGTPQEWYDAVLASKDGNKDAIVVAGLILQPDMGCTGGGANAIKSAHWAEFIAMWGQRGIAGSVCADDYAPFFAKAVSVIDETCDNFQPPG